MLLEFLLTVGIVALMAAWTTYDEWWARHRGWRWGLAASAILGAATLVALMA